MAEKLEEFQKEFAEIKKAAVAESAEIKKNAQMVAQTSGVIGEGIKEIGLRIAELKDGGMAGAKLQDFLIDTHVKQMYASLNDFMASLDKELTRIGGLYQSSFKKTSARYVQLLGDIKTEIAARKKQFSTKVGTGNKSLPDMEKLLVEVEKYEHDGNLAAVMYFQPETIADHRGQMLRQIQDQISKTRQVVLTAFQKEMDEQALELRNLNRNIGSAKSLSDQVLAQCAKATKALKDRKNQDLMAAKVTVAKPMKQLDELAQKYERAAKDSWISGQIKKSKDKAAIEAGMKTVVDLRNKARAEVSKIANARLNA